MTKDIVAIKTKIYPTKKQKQYFNRCFGIRRFAWNWGLENWDTYKSWTKLDKAWNHSEMKETKPYLYEVNSMIKNMAFKELAKVFERVFKEPSKCGKPKFKSKKKDVNRFSMFAKNKLALVPNGKWLHMTTTRSFGRIKFKSAEDLSFLNNHRIAEWTISERYGDYFISIIYERTNHKVDVKQSKEKIGIDAGMKTMITSFDGENFSESNLPKKIKSLEDRIDYISKKISKKKYNSIRWKRLNKIRNKIYLKISNIKKDFLDKLVNHICKTYKQINFESYNFNLVNANKRSRRKLYRLSPYMLQSKLENKSKEYGNNFNLISGEPTTQTCSCCGHRYIKEEKLTLKDRVFKCSSCGFEIGRDKNSAINIFNLA